MLQPNEHTNEHQYHTIWTPELVEIDLPLAGIARRCMAMLADQVIIYTFLGVIVIVTLITISVVGANLYTIGDLNSMMFVVTVIALVLFCIIFYFLYFWFFHAFNSGQTLGKAWLGIRLVTDRGGRANIWTCFIRSLFDIVDILLFYGGVSAIMILTTKREKRIADFAAGTLVILDR